MSEIDLGADIQRAMHQSGQDFAQRMIQDTSDVVGSLCALQITCNRLDVTPFYQGIQAFLDAWEVALASE